MKSVIICLMTVLYIANASNMDMLLRQLKQSKATVQSTIEQLERLQKKVARDTVDNVKNQEMQQMRGYINSQDSTISAIREDVEAAKAEGKDAQPCYDTALYTMRSILNTATYNGQQCIDTAKSSIESELNFINALVSTGYGLKGQLDGIVMSCYNTNHIEMETCIALKLGQVNTAVRNLQSETNSAGNTARSVSNKIALSGFDCLSNVYSLARSQLSEVTLAAYKCVEAL